MTYFNNLLMVMLSSFLTTSAWAGFNEGLAAYENGDYVAALEEWLPPASEGDAVAQNYLGEIYFYGEGVPQDYAEAVDWYRLAAEQGHAGAQFNLGRMYHYGNGVQNDLNAAVSWYRLAANQGNISAQLFLDDWFGRNFDKFSMIDPRKIDRYSGQQLFEAAYQAYVCSFIMTLAEQTDKAQALRSYSVKLVQQEIVSSYGKGRNDVNFPGALEAMKTVDEYIGTTNFSKPWAAAHFLINDSRCTHLNQDIVMILGLLD